MKTDRRLVLDLERSDVAVGEPVAIRVRDRSRRPVADATVATRTKRTTTDENGVCQLAIRAPGFWTVTASKPDTDRVSYGSARELLRAVAPSSSLRAGGSRVTSSR